MMKVKSKLIIGEECTCCNRILEHLNTVTTSWEAPKVSWVQVLNFIRTMNFAQTFAGPLIHRYALSADPRTFFMTLWID